MGTLDREETTEIDFEILPSPWLTLPNLRPATQGSMRWETQRACPFRCTLCQHWEAEPTYKKRPFHSARIKQEQALLAASRRTGTW